MRCTIGITFHRYGGHSDDWTFSQPLFQIVIFRFAFGEALPPAVIVDHDFDVVRIIESLCATLVRRIVEMPLRRSLLPDELRKIVAVLAVTCAAAIRGKIKLIPPFEF